MQPPGFRSAPRHTRFVVTRPAHYNTRYKHDVLPRSLIGMGISGDDADTILNGGVTGTDLGPTLFTPVR